MNCPVCKEPMIILELLKVEIDYCYNCSGIWLDEGELELLLDDNINKETLLSSFKPVSNCKEKKRKCPICLKKMKKINVGVEERILIDKCKYNHGLWFDKGELKQVIEFGCIDKDSKILALLKDMFHVKFKKYKE